jgi:hypothetical protein
MPAWCPVSKRQPPSVPQMEAKGFGFPTSQFDIIEILILIFVREDKY